MDPWVPISKAAAVFLPNDRIFTELEALFSIQLDHNNNVEVSIMGIAARFGWSRKKVRCFLDRIGVSISYPENTSKIQNQRGQIRGQIRDRSGKKRGQINFIDFNDLQVEKDRSEENRGQIRDRSGATTIEKEKENKKHSSFLQNEVGENGDFFLSKRKRKLTGWKLKSFLSFWEAFNLKRGKAEAADSWLDIPGLNEAMIPAILTAAKAEARARAEYTRNGRKPKWAQGWLSARRWENEPEKPESDGWELN